MFSTFEFTRDIGIIRKVPAWQRAEKSQKLKKKIKVSFWDRILTFYDLDIAYTNREHQRYLVNQMDELSARQMDEKEKAMREHEADLAKEAAYQQRIKDALKFY